MIGTHPLTERDLQEFETSFRRRHPVVWWSTLLGPGLVTAAVIALVLLTAGPEFTRRLIATAVATFLFFGRFVILSGQEGQLLQVSKHLTSEQLFLMVCWLDLMVAVMLAFHIGFLFKLPIIGRKIAALVADGQMILVHHPWMKRTTFVGLVVFVMFPLAATGSIGGSIFGRLLGMSRQATLLGIGCGTLLGNGIMYFGSDFINAYFDKDHPAVKYGGILAIVLVIVLLERRYRRMKRSFLEKLPAGPRDSQPVSPLSSLEQSEDVLRSRN